jgi:plastocyanin
MRKTIWSSIVLTIALAGQLSAQTGFNGFAINGNLIFPQIAIGGGYTTDVFLQNPGNVTNASGILYFFSDQGLPFTVQFNGNPTTQIPVNVPTGSIQKITVTDTSSTASAGWAMFVTNPGTPDPLPEVYGSVVFTNVSGTTVLTQTGVVGTRYSTGNFKRVSMPIQVVDSLSTGIALVNVGAFPLNITFELKDANGGVVSQVTPQQVSPLAPGAHFAAYVPGFFPNVPMTNFLGTLDLVTDGDGMVPLALLLSGPLISTIPIINVPVHPQTFTVADAGFSFSPSTLTITAGDTVNFMLTASHDAVEVSKSTWDANGATSNGGFSVPFGGGSVTFNKPGTYYYVCVAHVAFGMKGTIIVN